MSYSCVTKPIIVRDYGDKNARVVCAISSHGGEEAASAFRSFSPRCNFVVRNARPRCCVVFLRKYFLIDFYCSSILKQYLFIVFIAFYGMKKLRDMRKILRGSICVDTVFYID